MSVVAIEVQISLKTLILFFFLNLYPPIKIQIKKATIRKGWDILSLFSM